MGGPPPHTHSHSHTHTHAHAHTVAHTYAHTQAYVIGEAGLVEELAEGGITALGGPADSVKSWDFGAAQEPEMPALDPDVGRLPGF